MPEYVASFVIIKRTAHILSPFSQGGRRNPSKLSDKVPESIKLFKLMKPRMFGREIRERLLNDGMCDGGNLPGFINCRKGNEEQAPRFMHISPG